jgi:hypothetical protein
MELTKDYCQQDSATAHTITTREKMSQRFIVTWFNFHSSIARRCFHFCFLLLILRIFCYQLVV